MRKKIVAVAIAASLLLGGCAAWWAKLKTDPVAALQDGAGFIRSALGLARAAFDIWAASASPEDAAQARLTFNTLVGNVERGLTAAQSTLRTVARARGPEPDAVELLGDARSAVGDLNAFLAGLPGAGPGRAMDPTMREALAATEAASRP